jgi:hypothetical protein
MLDHRDVGKVPGHGQDLAGGLLVARGQGVGLLRGFRARVAVDLDVAGNAESLPVRDDADGQANRRLDRRVVVAELDIDAQGAPIDVLLDQAAELGRGARRDITDRAEPVLPGQLRVLLGQSGGEAVEAGLADRDDLALERPLLLGGRMVPEGPKVGNQAWCSLRRVEGLASWRDQNSS